MNEEFDPFKGKESTTIDAEEAFESEVPFDKKFLSRGDVEKQILFKDDWEFQFQNEVYGQYIHTIKRWSTRTAMLCSDYVLKIITGLYPEDIFFLASIDYSNPVELHKKLYNILVNRVMADGMKIIFITMGIRKHEDQEAFLDETYPEEVLELFSKIMALEMTEERVFNILKKTVEILEDKFQLQRLSVDFSNIPAYLISLSQNSSQQSS